MAKAKLKTVVVKKSRWHAPLSISNSAMLDSTSKRMCCLGFCAKDAGYASKDIRDRAYPDALADMAPFRKAFPKLDDNACRDLARINDDHTMSQTMRAQLITEAGKNYGVRFQFVP